MARIVFAVDGMDCGGCARAVERIIQKNAPGAVVTVDLGAKRVEAEIAAQNEGLAASLAAALTAGGYPARPAA